MKIELGTKVFCRDKEVGNVSRIILDGETFDISQLTVAHGLTGPERLVPVTLLDRIDESGVYLSINSQDFDQLAEFIEREYRRIEEVEADVRDRARVNLEQQYYPVITESYYIPYTPVLPMTAVMPEGAVVEHYNIEPGEEAISEGMDVVTSDNETLGSVKDVVYDPTDKRLLSFNVETGLIFHKETIIPADWIEVIEPRNIRLNRTKTQVKELQEEQKQQ